MHDVHWLNEGRLLYVSYQGYQTAETVRECLDDMAKFMDTSKDPIFLIINWLEVTKADKGVLQSNRGHRTYSHPMAARGILVGFDPQEAFENEVTSTRTRGEKNTTYFKTLDEALEYAKEFMK
jgi:hypothetical protein